ncbi:glycerophosphodiester phosphodiesterase [Solibacillus sp. R5-41]|uniref:glycerophosphodiester phosphodiesterase family protein n=1 Tax=Solibacillus sp. R5-41 TaxID=2048654 RepID=UPI000C12803E|nr:glycerophosphodiester phosphodiesterase family protein [Solibacillus sp. R5-41]ATP40605.1 glycerophosphodiester phosphodiesterase [Solibacillus sp. R5-41]
MNKRKGKKRWIILGGFILLAAFVWINNTSLFYSKNTNYKILAHRGLAQTFDISKVESDTNTAEMIYPPEHPYLENTIPSIKAAFDHGADVVELDIKLTKDRQLAVFHDFTLEYRTNGKGEVKDFTMDELKKLDIGYRYTADQGATYPFRGQGRGMLPSLDEVFAAFPNKEFLIHDKDATKETTKVLWDTYLSKMSKNQLNYITVYGDGESEGFSYLRSKNSDMKLLTKAMMKEALLKYELIGWTGYIPKELHNMELHLPLNYAKYLWGWPNKFVDRMASVNTRVVIVEGNGKWSEGFDTKGSLEKIPEGYQGYIWTNRVDRIAE